MGWPEVMRGNRKRIPGFGEENAWGPKTLRWFLAS